MSPNFVTNFIRNQSKMRKKPILERDENKIF